MQTVVHRNYVNVYAVVAGPANQKTMGSRAVCMMLFKASQPLSQVSFFTSPLFLLHVWMARCVTQQAGVNLTTQYSHFSYYKSPAQLLQCNLLDNVQCSLPFQRGKQLHYQKLCQVCVAMSVVDRPFMSMCYEKAIRAKPPHHWHSSPNRQESFVKTDAVVQHDSSQ